MPAINVVGVRTGIGRESQMLSIGTQGNMLRHVTAGGKQERFAAALDNRVQMGPAIHVGKKCDAAAGRPVEIGSAMCRWHRSAQCFRTAP
jgi:hypothetical protein